MSPVFLTGRGDFCIINLPGGAVAQLGEYVTGSHGVAGSSPVSSTNKFFKVFILPGARPGLINSNVEPDNFLYKLHS